MQPATVGPPGASRRRTLKEASIVGAGQKQYKRVHHLTVGNCSAQSSDDIQVMSSDLNVESIGALIPPSCVFEELPADLAVYEHVVARRHLQILPRLNCRDC